MVMDASIPIWQVGGGRQLILDQPRLMGILNVTPDSFFDGGKYGNAEQAVEAALRMRNEGASIIDVGGESTRPGALSVAFDEQMRRTIPVIEGIRAHIDSDDLLISIDTTNSVVARAALDAGANIINDVSGGTDDAEMFAIAGARQCGIVLMHRLTAPRRDSYSTRYSTSPDYGGDVVGAVREYLARRCDEAVQAGIQASAIVIDPGLGFGKSVEQNFELVGRIQELAELGYMVLSAASRKSFVGAAVGADQPANRLSGSLAISVAHYLAGVRLFRVHDVAAHRQALAVAASIVNVAQSASAEQG